MIELNKYHTIDRPIFGDDARTEQFLIYNLPRSRAPSLRYGISPEWKNKRAITRAPSKVILSKITNVYRH